MIDAWILNSDKDHKISISEVALGNEPRIVRSYELPKLPSGEIVKGEISPDGTMIALNISGYDWKVKWVYQRMGDSRWQTLNPPADWFMEKVVFSGLAVEALLTSGPFERALGRFEGGRWKIYKSGSMVNAHFPYEQAAKSAYSLLLQKELELAPLSETSGVNYWWQYFGFSGGTDFATVDVTSGDSLAQLTYEAANPEGGKSRFARISKNGVVTEFTLPSGVTASQIRIRGEYSLISEIDKKLIYVVDLKGVLVGKLEGELVLDSGSQ